MLTWVMFAVESASELLTLMLRKVVMSSLTVVEVTVLSDKPILCAANTNEIENITIDTKRNKVVLFFSLLSVYGFH